MFALLLAVIYVSFISLGLPDSLLGGAWPIMYREFDVPVSFSGIIFFIISAGTVISSLMSDRLTKKVGTGRLTAISVATTAAALLGFSVSTRFWMLCVIAIPYGLGAGSVDAALNNYVALHYKSRHMSWLHCMWGVGASTGPYIMSAVLTGGHAWNSGYRIVGIIQVVLSAILFVFLPLWKKAGKEGTSSGGEDEYKGRPIPLKDVIRFKGAKEIMLTFFCYSMIEQTCSLWAAGYMVFGRGIDTAKAAGFAGMFFLGITAGRALSGFLTMKFDDDQMMRIGEAVIAAGIILIFLPFDITVIIGLIVTGLGCAPIYPSIIHSTPVHFGRDKSQAMVGIQMAAAYVGTTIMPPVFGVIAENISVKIFPLYLTAALVLMAIMYETVVKKTSGGIKDA